MRLTMILKLAVGPVVAICFVACGSSTKNAPVTSASPTPTSTATTTQATAGCVDTNSVTLQNYAFNPNCIQITANQNVLFTNLDTATHTVTSNAGSAVSFDSGNLVTNATFEQSFSSAPSGGATINGTCTIHPFMTFSVVVKPQ